MGLREQLVAEIFGRPARGIKLGLDNIRAAAADAGNPQDALRIIHVAGTNGKGSVCSFIESIARASGLKTGLYTSPHLLDFEERYLINARPVPSEAWLAVYRDLREIVIAHDLSFFEIATLIAFELFRREGVELAVIETGLGGRLDATNIVTPLVSVITRIGIDHVEYLGDNLLAIAGEKLGILKPGVPLVMAPQEEQAVVEKARAVAALRGVPFHEGIGDDGVRYNKKTCRATITVDGVDVELPLAGDYQAGNAYTALAAVKLAFPCTAEVQRRGLAATFVPGRFQIAESGGRQWVFDVGHNPQAAKQFCRMLRTRFPEDALTIVTGIMADKDHGAMMAIYAGVADALVCVQPKTPRAAAAADLAAEIPPTYPGRVSIAGDIRSALSAPGAPGSVVCICGSFYTVGEAMAVLGIAPYPSL